MHTQNRQTQAALTPAGALDLLRKGNERFQANLKANRNLLAQVNETSEGQFPFAVILSCIDSRVSAELVFDQGLGDIFSVRVAGNVLNDDILGSMEFACKLAGSKLVVVLGHTSCGAVKGAVAEAELGHLTGLLEKIRPSVDHVKAGPPMDDADVVQAVADHNVDRVVARIRATSTVLDGMIRSGAIGIVGGMYSVETGAVEFHDLVTGE